MNEIDDDDDSNDADVNISNESMCLFTQVITHFVIIVDDTCQSSSIFFFSNNQGKSILFKK